MNKMCKTAPEIRYLDQLPDLAKPNYRRGRYGNWEPVDQLNTHPTITTNTRRT
jgi:hypothetical protein